MAYHVPPDSLPSTTPSQTEHPPSVPSEDSTTDVGSEDQAVTITPGGRRRSSTKVPGLKRAFSSPSMRNLATGESANMSSMDKKRNKLGYHRTAVACGHCRRRKIRCITANDDKTGRCQNCIRLKKECQFFPVDQQGASPGRRLRAESKTEGTPNDVEDSTGSASPRVLTSSTIDQIQNANGQIGTPPLTDDGSGYHSLGGSGAQGGPSEFGSRSEYDYHHGYNLPHHLYQYHGQPQYPQTGDRGQFDPNASHYYPPQSPYTSPPLSGSMKTSPQMNTHQFTEPSPRGSEFGWTPQPPVRSMPLADTEEVHHMYSAYRANSFPSVPHQLGNTPDMNHMQGGHPGLMQHDSRQTNFATQYPPNAYHQVPAMGWTSSTVTSQMAHVPVSSDSYQSAWYPPTGNLPYVREEDDNLHNVQGPSHTQKRFQPNPG